MRYLTPARTAAFAAVAALAVGSVGGVAYAQDDEPPVSAVQLCAATDIDQVDALLARVADTELVQDLAPLASLTVPRDPDGVVLAANVDLDQVRTALNCTPTIGEPTPTAELTGESTPTADPDPTTTAPPTTGTGTSGFDQLDDVPSVAAETGGGPE
ncbi:hypothetical protein WY02_03475 [Pseudonocardia sp. AL041005-10]|nr:hypothetical protein [Pseudonocardia sp. AL041005-10]ALE77664.1 hypothetical protein WY02_03475 [Pseudonocardia sp. AL041005-10]